MASKLTRLVSLTTSGQSSFTLERELFLERAIMFFVCTSGTPDAFELSLSTAASVAADGYKPSVIARFDIVASLAVDELKMISFDIGLALKPGNTISVIGPLGGVTLHFS